MKNLTKDLIEHIYDYSIGDKDFWKSKFSNVINEIKYFNASKIVEEYFNHNYFRYKDIEIDIINCTNSALHCLVGTMCHTLFYLDDTKFKQYLINNILHILKSNNHQFYH